MMQLIKDKFYEVIKAIAPLIGVVCILQFTLVHAPVVSFLQFLIGSAMATVGMVMFFMGIDIGILPMGRIIGSEMPQKSSVPGIIAVAFAIGFATTIAEPDVLVLSSQVDALTKGHIPRSAVLYAVAVGLAIFVALAMLRIVYGFKMIYMLAAGYSIIILLSFFTPAEFIPLAYDAGSVTTGVLTAPVVIALALGLSSVLAGRSALSDGFGLLGFASIGPIITIMIMGILWS
jgi:hypothetical protein